MRPTFAQAHPPAAPPPSALGRYVKATFLTGALGLVAFGLVQQVDLSTHPHLRAIVECAQTNASRVVRAVQDRETPHLRECRAALGQY